VPPETVETILRRGLFDAGAIEISANRFRLSTPTPAHGHDFLEMAVVSDGRGVHESQDGQTSIARGTVVLVRPGQWHGYVECDSLVVDNLYVGPGVAQKCFGWVHDVPAVAHLLATSRSVRKLHLDPDALERVVGWLGQLSTSSGPDSDRGPGSDAVRIGLLLAILGEVASTSSIVASSPTRPDLVAQALRLLATQLAGPWSLEELAFQVHISPGHLSRLFRRSLGVPPMRYLDTLRAERAAALLIETDLPIAAIGEAVGWSDPNYASRRFRLLFGVSPSGYRADFVPR
jgi:AraC family transcriptional regulator, L-rhamnose operon transcriptional activator RhaR